jgi:DNA helicase-2/ATP-dependent DNA helicase PcrA
MPVVRGLGGVSTPSPERGLQLSPQQQAVLDYASVPGPNFIVEAVAGAGKTSTLAELCKRLRGSIVFLVFNRKNVGDIEQKLQRMGIGGVKVSTFHSAGFAAWRNAFPGVRSDDRKLDVLMTQLQVPKEFRGFTAELAGLAKQACVGINWMPSERSRWSDLVEHYDVDDLLKADDFSPDTGALVSVGIDWAVKLLDLSIANNEHAVDFNDMLHAPLLAQSRFIQYDWVLVDEAQDTNLARMLMAERMLKPGGRLVAVGDPHQAIYGFTGAESDALDQIADRFSCARLPLTVTYRCPKAVVQHARKWVSHITAHESAPEGSVGTMEEPMFLKLTPKPSDAVLCRNTKPLVELAFSYIRRRVPCHVEGREIGQGLIQLIRRWRDVWRVDELASELEEFLQVEGGRLRAKGKLAKLEALEDRIETLLVLIESMKPSAPIRELEEVISGLFRDTPGGQRETVTLSTIHKAKGREWPKVFLLGRNRYMPSKYATQDWQLDQEKNLIYVAVTRAQEELIEVRVPLPNEQPTAEAVVEWKTTQLAAQRPGLIEAPRFDEQASKALRMAAAQPQIADEQVVHDAVLLPRPSLPDVNPLLVKALMQQKGLTFGEALRQVVEAMEGA